MSARINRFTLLFILAAYLLLAVGYGIATPLFETPDEHLHYFTADFIAREGRLPVIGDPGLMGQEAAQPPLYYVLASLLIRSVASGDATGMLWANPRTDTSAVAGQLWHNPLADPEDPRGESRADPPINVNMFIHTPAEAWPWRDFALAAHLARLLSTLFGLGTLLCIYGAGRTVWPDAPDRALTATALVAFLPQFAFLHGAVTNDSAVTFFSAAAIWQMLRLLMPERTGAGSPRRQGLAYALLGVTIGLAMLSKTAGILLLVYCVGVLSLHALLNSDTRRWARALAVGVLIAAPALVLSGWLLWRNWALYGDPTAANQFILMAGGERPYTLLQVWYDMDRVWLSLFAIFGWMNLQPPAWVYIVWNVIVLTVVAGAVWGIWRARAVRRERHPALDDGKQASGERPKAVHPWQQTLFHPAVVLLGWFLLVTLAWLQFMLRTPADQGRLFFPALIPLALGAAYGLSQWPRPWVPLVATGLALLTSVYCLLFVIPQAYAQSPSVATMPADVLPLDITFEEGLELLGARVDTPVVAPGEWAWLTLYWRARPDRFDYAPLAYLELFGRGFERIGLLTGYHGRGNYPSTLWPEGVIIADRMAVRVRPDAVAPVEARLTMKLEEDVTGVDIATVKVIPNDWPARGEPVARLGEAIELAAVELDRTTAAPGDSVSVRLQWQVAAPPGPADLHVFVHLGDPTQPPVAQADGPVMAGAHGFSEYPPRLWAAGETFGETVRLVLPPDLPPGQYPVNLGVYDFATGSRLPVFINGERTPNDTIPLGVLTVE